MILPYLIKSTLCFTILFGFYKVVLEHKPMHHIKRCYLLLAIVFSFTLPLITFTYEAEITPEQQWIADFAQGYTYGIEADPLAPVEKQSDLPATILWFIYGAGLLVFGTRYVLNLVRLKRKIATSQQLQEKEFTLSLVTQSIIPHSFLRWIFLNKTAYLQQEIAPEVLAHEATHVRQKHSWDILFIEFMQVLFWFNPLLWIAKKAIKLNHEFLADQGVIINNSNIAIYQNILLSYASSTHHTALESPFNYSLTKKRILMLSQTFSRKRAVISALILIPIIGLCLFLFNNEIKAQQKDSSNSEYTQQFILGAIKNNKKPLVIEITSDQIKINGQASSLATFQKDIDTITQDWEETDYTDVASSFLFKNNSEHFLLAAEREYAKTHISKANGGSKLLPPPPPPPPSPKFTNDSKLKKGDTLTITITDTGEKHQVIIGEADEDTTRTNFLQELEKAEKMEMTSVSQKPATQKEIAIYNRLAKKYNAYNGGEIKNGEVVRMYDIYSRMTSKQKKRAESYPVLPPPPPPPPAPKKTLGDSGNKKANEDKWTVDFKKMPIHNNNINPSVQTVKEHVKKMGVLIYEDQIINEEEAIKVVQSQYTAFMTNNNNASQLILLAQPMTDDEDFYFGNKKLNEKEALAYRFNTNYHAVPRKSSNNAKRRQYEFKRVTSPHVTPPPVVKDSLRIPNLASSKTISTPSL